MLNRRSLLLSATLLPFVLSTKSESDSYEEYVTQEGLTFSSHPSNPIEGQEVLVTIKNTSNVIKEIKYSFGLTYMGVEFNLSEHFSNYRYLDPGCTLTMKSKVLSNNRYELKYIMKEL